MQLLTLGTLKWPGVSLTRPKLLLLLAYLALEGLHPRRDLADLFWPESTDPLVNLRVALQHLRQAAPGCVVDEGRHLRTTVSSDAGEVLVAAARDDLAGVERLYRGKFLSGLADTLGPELEEWVYATRERVARAVRASYLRAARRAGDPGEAARLAAQALAVPGADTPEPEDLPVLHALLARAGHPGAADVRRIAAEFGLPLESTSAAPGLLPQAPGRVPDSGPPVGRGREVAQVRALLAHSAGHLVTVTGPGGIGKSRLAEAVGREAQDVPGERVVWVPLEAVPDPALIAGRISDALGLAPPLSSDALAHVIRALNAQPTTLILDNAEHLIRPEGGVATVTGTLLAGCPSLRVLVTSREPLGLSTEQLYPLEGLAWDGTGEALALFQERARRFQPDFTVTPGTQDALRRICERLAGSPLGIELAAALTRSLSPADLAGELEEGLGVLEAVNPDSGRHASLRAVFGHSWERLTPEEQAVLRRLAVFRGGFTRRAAGAVAGATLPVLAALVDRSLLRLTAAGRYQIHPLVAEYAAEQLAAQPHEGEAAREAHARFFVALAEEAGPALYGSEQERWFARLAEDHAWGRAQLVHALRHPAVSPAGQAVLLWAAGGLSRLSGDVATAAPMLERAVALARAHGLGDIELLALIHRGLLAYSQGNLEEARRDLEACLALAPRLGNPALEIYTYSHLGEHFSHHGDFRQAEPLLQFAARQARSLAGSWQTAKASLQLAGHLRNSGQLEAARREYEACLALLERLNPTVQLADCLTQQAALLLDLGEHEAARAAVRRGLDLLEYERSSQPQIRGLAEQVLAELALEDGDLVEAEYHLRHAAETFRQADLRPQQLYLLPTLARLLHAQGYGALAARVLEAAETLSAQLGLALPVPLRGRMAVLRERLGAVGTAEDVLHVEEPGALLTAWSQGRGQP